MPVSTSPPTEDADPSATEDLGARFADDVFTDDFDDADFRPAPAPWYRTTPAVLAGGAIAAALVAIVVSAVLLVAHRSHGRDEPSTAVDPSPSASASAVAPSRSEEPSAVPSPPPSSESSSSAPSEATSANTQYVPPSTHAQPPAPNSVAPTHTNITTPITRPPEISVHPTPHPAFPKVG